MCLHSLGGSTMRGVGQHGPDGVATPGFDATGAGAVAVALYGCSGVTLEPAPQDSCFSSVLRRCLVLRVVRMAAAPGKNEVRLAPCLQDTS